MGTELLFANITRAEVISTYLLQTGFTRANLMGTHHLPTDFTFCNVMDTENLPAQFAAKCAFGAHLLSTKCAGEGMRLTDMLIAT
jgi:hypothetical protein